MDEYYSAIKVLPGWLAQPLSALPPQLAGSIRELRLRAGCGICFNAGGRQSRAQDMPQCPQVLRDIQISEEQLDEVLYALCGGSVHSHQAEIAAGYVTAANGCRVGIGGQYAETEQGVVLQAASSLNMRIARERHIELPAVLSRALEGRFTGLLVVGEPGSGKTTFLRELARILAARGRIVAAADGRRELFPAGMRSGQAGMMPDVISGLPKERALQMALRTLAPDVIVFDELGGMDEVKALEQGFFSGVDFAASLHAADLDEAFHRPQVQYLKQHEMLRIIVLLGGKASPGKIKEVYFT